MTETTRLNTGQTTMATNATDTLGKGETKRQRQSMLCGDGQRL
ncbi:hypothetical protein [Candidatus Minimicrobia vallesae]|nr:hypothetical protein [Candidatus Minimicrobia vallesae]